MNTKTRIAFIITLFTILCGISAIIAWVGGFNFDARNPDVAFHFVLALSLSAAAAFMIGGTIDL